MSPRVAHTLNLLMLSAMVAASVYTLTALPDGARIAMNFHADGTPRGTSPAGLALSFMPGITVFSMLVIWGVSHVEPRADNIRRSRSSVLAISVALTATYAAVHGGIVALALGIAVDMGRLMLLTVGGVFVVIGNVMGKVRPNFFVGIRTPWTLSDDHVWDKTHRMGGRLMMLGGTGTAGLGVRRLAR